MTNYPLSIDDILGKLNQALFPYYDDEGAFCWDRRDTRSIIRLNPETLKKADRMLSRVPIKYSFTENQSLGEVIELLGDESIKQNTWVQGEVVDVYRVLADHGRLHSIEARLDGELAGAVCGIDLSSVFIVETLLTIGSDSSKAALCYAMQKYAALGYDYFDVQRPHPKNHPCSRLGEETMPIADYITLLKKTLAT